MQFLLSSETFGFTLRPSDFPWRWDYCRRDNGVWAGFWALVTRTQIFFYKRILLCISSTSTQFLGKMDILLKRLPKGRLFKTLLQWRRIDGQNKDVGIRADITVVDVCDVEHAWNNPSGCDHMRLTCHLRTHYRWTHHFSLEHSLSCRLNILP